MRIIFYQVATQSTTVEKPAAAKKQRSKDIRDDLEELDGEEQYYKFMEENPNAGQYNEFSFCFSLASCTHNKCIATDLGVASRAGTVSVYLNAANKKSKLQRCFSKNASQALSGTCNLSNENLHLLLFTLWG